MGLARSKRSSCFAASTISLDEEELVAIETDADE